VKRLTPMTGETCTSTFCANIKHMNIKHMNIKQHTVLVAMVGARLLMKALLSKNNEFNPTKTI
jgi:hypothetical protein